jgi:hypothetical protein
MASARDFCVECAVGEGARVAGPGLRIHAQKRVVALPTQIEVGWTPACNDSTFSA